LQTIRIQFENAKEHEDKKGSKTRRKRIQRVLVESGNSSEDESDVEDDAVSELSGEEYEVQENYRKPKNVHDSGHCISDPSLFPFNLGFVLLDKLEFHSKQKYKM
jgi:hypothetical protein